MKLFIHSFMNNNGLMFLHHVEGNYVTINKCVIKNSQETFLSNFLRLEFTDGIILILAAVLAIVLANSQLQSYYALLINTPVEINIDALGIVHGLMIGKQVGVSGFCWLAIKLKFSQLPGDIFWMSLYGSAALCGIGFTMSLFIGSPSFEETSDNLLFDERPGILFVSLASGVIVYLVLRKSLP